MASQSPKYFVLQTLWSAAQGQHLYPGTLSNLEDLTPEQIEKLTAGNVIMPNTPAGTTADNRHVPAAPAQAEPAAAADEPAAPKRHKAKE